ncbi:tumor necrosis factor receptor superfamily member 6 [Chanos chanos]|uniref:Tumor necrosis factor receptor superfamily member 6 n=1 Tax=Chanos chanos TaxID=29144 RepID=A0A6J2WG83_CHACN|nr:tumor necrosis factor receptor superfamily member 6-like [Chanos chanos]
MRGYCLMVPLFLTLVVVCPAVGKSRVTRNEKCTDGTYEEEGKTCCLCSSGEYLDGGCSSTKENCRPCSEGNTYQSVANKEPNCEPCTICNYKANLETEKNCTVNEDTVCKCRKGYYCNPERRPCKVCHPCSICEGQWEEVESCTATSDTVCKEEAAAPAVIAIPCVGAALIFAFLGYKFGKKSRCCSRTDAESVGVQEMEHLQGVDLEPHLQAIADALGWKVVRHLARLDNMSQEVENVQISYPTDSAEWSYRVLKAWTQKQGLERGYSKLITTLRREHYSSLADKVAEIVKSGQEQSGSNGKEVNA